MGTTGSVAFMFQSQGVFRLAPDGIDRDSLELELIDHGLVALDDGETDKGDKQLLVRCAFNDFGTMQTALEARGLHAISTESEYVAQTQTELPDDKADDVMELVADARGRRRRAERLQQPGLTIFVGQSVVMGAHFHHGARRRNLRSQRCRAGAT